jgi:hypothetical protein
MDATFVIIFCAIIGIFVGAPMLLFAWLKARKKVSEQQRALEAAERSRQGLAAQLATAQAERDALSKYRAIQEVEAHIRILREKTQASIDDAMGKVKARIQAANTEALRILNEAKQQAKIELEESKRIVGEARRQAKTEREESKRITEERKAKTDALVSERTAKAEALVESAIRDADTIIQRAKAEAERIAGDAFAAQGRANELAAAIAALEHTLKGYGTEFIVPTYSLLDELADEFGHAEAGQQLKAARSVTRTMIQQGRAAICDYVEANRKGTAIAFVIDAFNGKVDSVLARGKTENVGKLEQEIRDAFALVNYNGQAFRNARILPEYLEARVHELKCAAVARALQEREREEQRRIREQIREEERARKEYERAIKEAEKEERTLRQAMEKAQALLRDATDAQRAQYEAQLADLEQKLAEAEDKNKRAISMAQQTRTGHVYIISNIGSFGEDVFKIGMTRRLDPMERVRELGDASVPFEFDVHAVLYSEDAPALEHALHQRFLRDQMNKVNPRKEFFRVSLEDVRAEVEKRGIEAHWTMTAEAQSYRETLRIEAQLQANPDAAAVWEAYQDNAMPRTESIPTQQEVYNEQ